jgi:hypothetical protein
MSCVQISWRWARFEVLREVFAVLCHSVAGIVVLDVSKDVSAAIFSGQTTTRIIQQRNQDQMEAIKLH